MRAAYRHSVGPQKKVAAAIAKLPSPKFSSSGIRVSVKATLDAMGIKDAKKRRMVFEIMDDLNRTLSEPYMGELEFFLGKKDVEKFWRLFAYHSIRLFSSVEKYRRVKK